MLYDTFPFNRTKPSLKLAWNPVHISTNQLQSGFVLRKILSGPTLFLSMLVQHSKCVFFYGYEKGEVGRAAWGNNHTTQQAESKPVVILAISLRQILLWMRYQNFCCFLITGSFCLTQLWTAKRSIKSGTISTECPITTLQILIIPSSFFSESKCLSLSLSRPVWCAALANWDGSWLSHHLVGKV